MKRPLLYVLICGIILIVIYIILSHRGRGSKEGFDFSKISNFYGRWKVIKTETFQGSLISDEEFNQAIKEPIIIKENYISCFGVEENNITFKYNKISNKFKEGEIGDRTTSIFYGFLPEREFTHQYQVWKNNERTGTVFEILSKDQILFMFAGRFVIAEREKS